MADGSSLAKPLTRWTISTRMWKRPVFGGWAHLTVAITTVVVAGAVVSGCGATAEPAPHTEVQRPTPTVASVSFDAQLYDSTVNFYRVINRSFRSLDTRPVADVLAPGSNAASGYTELIRRTRAKGHRFEVVGEYEITDFKVVPGVSGGRAQVEFNLRHQKGAEVDSEGRMVRVMPATSSRAWIVFTKREGSWRVAQQNIDN